MIRSLPLVLILALAAGCSDWRRGRAASSILRTTDLATVVGANGSMTARQLIAARPTLAFMPYAGYSETIDSGAVSYRFNARDISSTAVDENARPEGVSFTRTFESEQAAVDYWRSAVSRVARDHAEPTSCWTVPGTTGGQVARWADPSIHLEIAVRRPIDVGPEVVPDRVMITAAREAPVHIPGSQVPCSEIAR
jgi:hypothetical protein